MYKEYRYKKYWDSSLAASKSLVPLGVAIALPITLPLAIQQPGQALSFRFDFDRQVPNDFQAVALEAGDAWSALLKDDVVVDLRIEYEDLSSSGNILAGVQPSKVKVKYEDYVGALFNDAISPTDLSAVNSLPLSSEGRQIAQSFQLGSEAPKKDKLKSESFAFLLDDRFGKGQSKQSFDGSFIDGNRSANNKNLLLTKPQARALGIDKNSATRGLDAVIKINSSVNWDTDRRDGVDSDRYDASSVLQHEIGHALGFVSGVDALDFLTAASEPVDVDLDKNSFSYATPLDLYRYSRESADLGVVDLTLGGSEKYFSLDGGESAVTNESGQTAYFATGSSSAGGDGYQASHWKANDIPLGVINSFLKKGESIDISELDIALLDSIGWDTEDNSAQRAAKIGLDWQQLTDELARERTAVTESLAQQWDNIPAFEAALTDAAAELDFKFQEKFRKEFNELLKKTDNGKLEDNDKEVAKFREKIQEEAEKRNKDIRKLPEDIAKTDEEVNEWLSLSTDKLSDKVKDAKGFEINRLSNIVKAAPAEERAELEPKLEAAFAQFSEKPDKLLEELLDSSGPANPFPWGASFRTWWYFQVADSSGESGPDEIIDPGLLYATGDAASDLALAANSDGPANFDSDFSQLGLQDSTDIPEPTSVLALFGIAVLGLGATRRKRSP